MFQLFVLNGLHALAISETHLDFAFADEEVNVHGYSRIFRRDRNAPDSGWKSIYNI